MGQIFGRRREIDDYPNANSRPTAINHEFIRIECPVCKKTVIPQDFECHLILCISEPQLDYNEETLEVAQGECIICLEEMEAGETIARLPCFCVYHKHCIEQWFSVKRTCPQHLGQ